jgi:putative pyruvate formate lyase activating enzyme
MWEEPCLSGERGSGTVFFSGCAVGCVYCQNHRIANGNWGKPVRVRRLAEIFVELQQQGAHNVNLVTPSHFVPQVIRALDLARSLGLRLPIVYNCSGYERVETLRLFEGYADIYLPDFKYFDAELAGKYSNCPDYARYATPAIQEMLGQVGKPVFDSAGMMQRGVIVRHLTLPGCLQDSKDIIRHLYQTFGDSIFLSIMNQFTPLAPLERYPELNRRITEKEYDELVDYAIALGVSNGFIQEGETAAESFIPEFDGRGV